jgi:hypothetical protein
MLDHLRLLITRLRLIGYGLALVYKPPCDREALELAARFDSAYVANAMKSSGMRHTAKRWHHKFDLHLSPQRGSRRSKYKHAALANVHAVARVVVARAIAPAEQERQLYLKPPRIPSLDGVEHIRTQFPLASFCCGLAHHIDDAVAPQAGDRFGKGGCVYDLLEYSVNAA